MTQVAYGGTKALMPTESGGPYNLARPAQRSTIEETATAVCGEGSCDVYPCSTAPEISVLLIVPPCASFARFCAPCIP